MSDWTPEQRIFQEWLASPFREPATQKELAERLGMSPSRLSEWKNLPGWYDAVNALARESVKENVPQLLKWGYQHAINGKYQYWAALMKMAGFDVDGARRSGVTTQIAIVFGDGEGLRPSDFTVSGGQTDE